jgi:hypothetical protein
MATIEESIPCEKCDKTAVLVRVTRDNDDESVAYVEGEKEYLNEILILEYHCRQCDHHFIKTLKGLSPGGQRG